MHSQLYLFDIERKKTNFSAIGEFTHNPELKLVFKALFTTNNHIFLKPIIKQEALTFRLSECPYI